MFPIKYDGSEYKIQVERERTPTGESIITVRIFAPNGELVGAGAYETGDDRHGQNHRPANARAALRRAIYQAASQWIDRQHKGHRFWGVYKRVVKRMQGGAF